MTYDEHKPLYGRNEQDIDNISKRLSQKLPWREDQDRRFNGAFFEDNIEILNLYRNQYNGEEEEDQDAIFDIMPFDEESPNSPHKYQVINGMSATFSDLSVRNMATCLRQGLSSYCVLDIGTTSSQNRNYPIGPLISEIHEPIGNIITEITDSTIGAPISNHNGPIGSPVLNSIGVIGSPVLNPNGVIGSPVLNPNGVIGSPVSNPNGVIGSPVPNPNGAIGGPVPNPNGAIGTPVPNPNGAIGTLLNNVNGSGSSSGSVSAGGSGSTGGELSREHSVGEASGEPIINDIISNTEAFCSNCEDGHQAVSRCRDCREYLCDSCVRAHQRVRLTKDHFIIRFSDLTPHTSPSLSPGYSGSSTQIVRATSHLSSAHITLIRDARAGAKTLRVAFGNVKKMMESVDMISTKQSSDLCNSFRQIINLLHERESILLEKIESIRRAKNAQLLSQEDALQEYITRLESIAESVEQGTINLYRASGDLNNLRQTKPPLAAVEDDVIVYTGPDTNLYRAVTHMGNVNSSAYALLSTGVGEGLACTYRGRMTTLQLVARNHVGDQPPIPSSSRDLVSASLALNNGNTIRCDVFDLGDGTFNITYSCPIEGVHLLHISVRGVPIMNSPFSIAVRSSRKYTTCTLPIFTFGREGDADGQLCRPWGVCCDHEGNIIVADRSNNRIQIFRPDGSFLFKFGSQGSARGQFDRPAGVAVDIHGRIIVVDKDNHRVQIFSNKGAFILAFGEKGSKIGQFNYPWDVATSNDGRIVVSDTRNHRIQQFHSDGTFINKYGFESTPNMWKHFDSPRGLCYTRTGHVIVTDFNNHRLVVVDPDLNNARFLGCEGNGVKQFLRPQGIALDHDGRIVVADSKNHRVQVIESNGTFIKQFGSLGKGIGQMDRPSGLCVSPDGRIIVVDFGNNRIQVF